MGPKEFMVGKSLRREPWEQVQVEVQEWERNLGLPVTQFAQGWPNGLLTASVHSETSVPGL